jgi:hypothetical protein
MSMSPNGSESNPHDGDGGFTSEGVEFIDIDGPVDRTVRPMRESLRRILEEKGLIPRRLQPPDTPPAPSDNTPS